MKIKQMAINKLIGEIKEQMNLSGKEVVEYSINELLNSLSLTETQLEYGGGEDRLFYELTNNKQFDWNKIGCVPMYTKVYFLNYESKTDRGYGIKTETVERWMEDVMVSHLVKLGPDDLDLDEDIEFDDDDEEFWLDLGFEPEDLY